MLALGASATVALLTDVEDLSLYFVLVCTGALAAETTLVMPERSRVNLFDNRTTGAFTLTVQTLTGAGVTLPQGQMTLTHCDSTNVQALLSGPGGALPVASESVAGITRYGTDAETLAGLLRTVAVHPAGLTAALDARPGPPAASTTVVGVTRFATPAEGTAGLLNTVAMTPQTVQAKINAIPLASETVVGLVERATTQESIDGLDTTRYVSPAGVHAVIATLPVTPITGTPYSLLRIPASGTGQQASPNVVVDASNRLGVGTTTPTVALDVVGQIKASDAAGTRTNLGLGTADDVQFARLGLGRVPSPEARLVFPAEFAQKILLHSDGATAKYGFATVSGALQVFAAGRVDLGSMAADGTTFTPNLSVLGSTGNIGLGTQTFGTGAQRVVALASGTGATTSPADAVQMWAADRAGAAGKAALLLRVEDGTSHVLGDVVGIGTPCAAVLGLGTYQRLSVNGNQVFVGQTSVQERCMALLNSVWVNATDATRTARLTFHVYDSVVPKELIRLEADGTAGRLGFFGSAAVVRPIVPAAATDQATTMALVNSVRTALINLGLAA